MGKSKGTHTWTIKEKVAYLLEKSERARNDDQYLTLLYWKFADKVDMNNLAHEYLENCTPATSIIRARCLLQSEGLYPPSPEVAARRGRKEQAFRHAISSYGEVPSNDSVDQYYEDNERY